MKDLCDSLYMRRKDSINLHENLFWLILFVIQDCLTL